MFNFFKKKSSPPAAGIDLKLPVDKQKFFGTDGLYFCGFRVAPTGQIREITSDAQKIARDIKRKEQLSIA